MKKKKKRERDQHERFDEISSQFEDKARSVLLTKGTFN